MNHDQTPAPQAETPSTPPAESDNNHTAEQESSAANPRRIKSFVRRAGRTTAAQFKAYESFGSTFLRPYTPGLIAPESLFTPDRAACPVVLEIGFGMGETTAHIAEVLPEVNFICCEVHEPGVGALLKRAGEGGLDNIRIIAHDAVEVLDNMLPVNSLAGLHLFFPDPWHKKRHHKRRLVQPEFLAKLVARLRPGAYIHMATDWQPYAQQMLAVLSANADLVNTASSSDGYAEKPHYRRLTKFENRGLKLGHGVWDLVFTKRPD